MARFCMILKWCLILSIIGSIGSCFIYSPRPSVTKERILKYESNSKLRAISVWILAHENNNSTNDLSLLKNLSASDKYYLFNALKSQSKYVVENPSELFNSTLSLEKFSEYLICTNSLTNGIAFIENFKTRIVAYERPGLVDEKSVAVYFESIGVLRLKTLDFHGLISGKGRHLKYDKKSHLWILDQE